MKPHGTYKLLGPQRGRNEQSLDPVLAPALRAQRIVDSLRCEIANNDQIQALRIRQVFANPRELFRVELEVPDMNYQRTTLLDRESLEELLEADEVRALLRDPTE